MNAAKIQNDQIRELAGLVQQSDKKSFTTLFDLLWDDMFTYSYSLVRDNSVAQDLVQEVWIDYWERRKTIVPQNIKSYLFKAVRFKCYNYLRDTKFDTLQLEVARSIGTTPLVNDQEDLMDLVDKVNAVLSGLPDRCREIFQLSRYNNFNNSEIAEGLNISQRTVENQISFAVRKLRKQLTVVRVFLCF